MTNNLPTGWEKVPYKTLLDEISTNGLKIRKKETLSSGKYPVIDQGQEFIGGYTNQEKNLLKISSPVVIFGDHTRIFKYIDFNFVPGADGIKVLKPINGLNPKLFYFFSQAVRFKNRGYSRHYQFLKTAEFNLPPEKIQQKIVDKIEELFSVIDANIVELKKTKTQLTQYKYAYVQKIIEDLKKNSTKVKLNDIAESVRYGSSTKTTEDSNNGVTVLRMGNYDEFGKKTDSKYKYLPKNHKEFPELLLKNGDLLFNRTNSAELVGKTMVYGSNFPPECSYASYLIRARFDNEKVNSKYVMYILNSLIGKTWIKKVVNQQVGQANVNGTKLKNFTFYLPNINEQNNAVDLIENSFSIVDVNIATIDSMLQKSNALKQSILKQAFEGKLV